MMANWTTPGCTGTTYLTFLSGSRIALKGKGALAGIQTQIPLEFHGMDLRLLLGSGNSIVNWSCVGICF